MHGPMLFYYMEIVPCGCQSIPLTQTPKVNRSDRRAALCDSRTLQGRDPEGTGAALRWMLPRSLRWTQS